MLVDDYVREETLYREAQAMQASLRRYVPGAVADQLSSGAELASGSRRTAALELLDALDAAARSGRTTWTKD